VRTASDFFTEVMQTTVRLLEWTKGSLKQHIEALPETYLDSPPGSYLQEQRCQPRISIERRHKLSELRQNHARPVLDRLRQQRCKKKGEGKNMYYSTETLCSKQNYWGHRLRKRKPASCRIRSGVLQRAQRGSESLEGIKALEYVIM
jgi:hypothetical protein